MNKRKVGAGATANERVSPRSIAYQTNLLALNAATQQNASASEELAATAEEMGGQAAQLQDLMSFFRIEEQTRAVRHRS